MKHPLIYTGKVWNWPCPACGWPQRQNFPPADYARCACLIRHKKERHENPDPERLAALWAARAALP